MFPRALTISLATWLLVTGAISVLAADTAKPVDLNTPRAFPKIENRAEWEARAKDIREQVLVSAGLWPMPPRPPIEAKVFDKRDYDGFSVEKVYFQTYPGFYLAGNLYRPIGKGSGPFPAILNPHGHWYEGRLVNNEDGSVPARCIHFARQGMIAFAIDMVGYNDTYFPDHVSGPLTAEKFATVHRRFATNQVHQLWGINLMGLQLWNTIRALDFLETLPDVDTKRLSCTGASGGGTQTFLLGAVDDRLATQAPIVMVSHTMQGGCLCENMAGLRVQFSNMEIAAAAAPRPQLLVAASGDWTRATMTVEGPSIAKIYDLFGARSQFDYTLFNFDHNYNRTTREAVYQWMAKGLQNHPRAEAIKEAPYEMPSPESMRVFPDGKLPADALTEAQFIDSMKQLATKQWQDHLPHDAASLKRYKEIYLPAWRRTMQLPAAPDKDAVEVTRREKAKGGYELIELAFKKSGAKGVVLVDQGIKVNILEIIIIPEETADWDSFIESRRHFPPTRRLPNEEEFTAYLYLQPIIHARKANPDHEQFANFYTTYNRTIAQWQVNDIASAINYGRGEWGQKVGVVLHGLRRAGVWAIMAAPLADLVKADLRSLNSDDDQTFMAADVFVPGLRRLGGLQGVALLSAPTHFDLIHNKNDTISSEIERTYLKLGLEDNILAKPIKLPSE